MRHRRELPFGPRAAVLFERGYSPSFPRRVLVWTVGATGVFLVSRGWNALLGPLLAEAVLFVATGRVRVRRRFRRALGGPHGGGGGDCAGDREPRRPLPPTLSGAALRSPAGTGLDGPLPGRASLRRSVGTAGFEPTTP